MKRQLWRRIFAVLVTTHVLPVFSHVRAQPFEFGGPGVNPEHYRLTTFAEGLNYPVGMAELSDGSILTAVSNGSSLFGSSSGQLIRLIDDDGDGQSDRQFVMANRVPGGGLTALKIAGDLIFTTGQGTGKPISIYRFGASLDQPVTLVGELNVNYPGRWLHPHSALAVREVAVEPPTYELFFQLGSDTNFNATTRTADLSSDIGVSGSLAGDAVHRVRITDNGDSVMGSDLTQIASGLRNAAGFTFDSQGNLYVQDNGIDGLIDANEPTSADELNLIRQNELGTSLVDFGFPDNYTEYRTGSLIGGDDRQPVVSFLPLPDPATGEEAEGPNDITFAPPSFPLPLRAGIFVGMHGKFSLGGAANEENPVVFVDLRDQSYFHFISNDERGVGHLDGLLATEDSLFLADISPRGGLNSGNTGVIYQLKSLIPSIDELTLAIHRGETDGQFDLDKNGVVDLDDRVVWVKDINSTYFGDATLDGRFDSADLTAVFQAGQYADGIDRNSIWATGDWNGDAEFDSSDLVRAFQDGGYEQQPPIAVPEPASFVMLTVGLIGLAIRRRPMRVADQSKSRGAMMMDTTYPRGDWLHSLTAVIVCALLTAAVNADESAVKVLLTKVEPITEPPCSYCSTQHLKSLIRGDDRVIAWLRAAHNGGAFPIRHFLAGPRVVNDTYGLFFYDPDGGYVAAYEKDYGYKLHGWRRGVMVVQGEDGTLWSALTGKAISGPQKGQQLKRVPSLVTDWNYWLMLHPESTTYDLFDGKTYKTSPLPTSISQDAKSSMGTTDKRLAAMGRVLGVEFDAQPKAFSLEGLPERACLQDSAAGQPMAVFWYARTETAVAFDRRVDGQTLTFYADALSPESAPFKDNQTGTRWTLAGRGIDGPLRGKELTWVNSIQCRWYAWSSEFPQTEIYAAKN